MTLANLESNVVRLGARVASSGKSGPRLSTGCQGIDDLLEGGIARGDLVEVFGPPGSGRTQLALTTAARAVVGGSSVIYVDCDGGCVQSRVRRLVHCAANLRVTPTESEKDDSGSACEQVETDQTVDALLRRWQNCRVCSWDELAAGLVHCLPELVQNLESTALIVIDSVAFPYRLCGRSRSQQRLEAFAGRMADIAMRYVVAVILINNSRLVNAGTISPRIGGDACAYPFRVAKDVGLAALGESWAHVCPCRLGLGWDSEGERVAHLVKSSRMPSGSASFQLSSKGIQSCYTQVCEISRDAAWCGFRSYSFIEGESVCHLPCFEDAR